MFTPHVGRLPRQTDLTRRVLVAAATLLAAVFADSLIGARVGLPADLPSICAASGVLALVAGVVLVRRAWRQHRERVGGTCRSVGFFGVGFLAVAATCLADLIGLRFGSNSWTEADFTVGGIALAVCAFVPGLLLMPGASDDPIARLRRVLDGVSIGVCMLFTSWVLVIAPNGRVNSVAFWNATIFACVISFAVVTALRTAGNRRTAVACAAGVVAALLGLHWMYYVLAFHILEGRPAVVGLLLLLAAPPLALYGAAAEPAVVDERGEQPVTTLASYPVLAVPAAAAIAVALYHIVAGYAFDRPSILLGLVGIAVLAIRESFGALDVARFARRISAQEAQFRNLVAGSTDVIMVLDADSAVRWQSPASTRQFGLIDQVVVGRQFPSMIHPADAAAVTHRLSDVRTGLLGADRPALIEARLRDGFGRWRETESSISDQRHIPEVDGLVVHIRDISERKEMERTLHRLACVDELTGLANRRQLLQSIVAQRAVPRSHGALLIVELDGFTSVNDVRGYAAGDAVLVETARRLRACAEGSDLLARLSGDEFAVLTGVNPVRAYALANRLTSVLAEPIWTGGNTVNVTASVGLAELCGGDSSDDVLRRADLALRRARQLGRGRIEWYDRAIEDDLVRRMTLEQELPQALERGELDLLYQPILDLGTRRPVGVEALLRWRHPRLGTLLPADVIPVAEDLRLIGPIGSWVFDEAIGQLARWHRDGRDLTMAINLSPSQLTSNLAVDVAALLRDHKVPADSVVVELAEGGLADAEAVGDHLSELRALGLGTALDEFGTGPESLTHLRRLPVDMVKVGRTFFAQSEPEGQTVPIIDVLVGLGRRLGIEVAAQGLEAPAQLELVRSAGCRKGQGHLFARPQPAERIEAYLDGFGGH